MAKKLLLTLGSFALATLPILAVASCSTEEKSTLSLEAAKFASVKTTKPEMESFAAANSIMIAKDSQAKLLALQSFAKVPTLNSGFTFEIKWALTSKAVPTSIDVKILITEKETKNTQEVTFVVTDLKPSVPSLETEAAKFAIPIVTFTPFISSEEVVLGVNDGVEQSNKYIALSLFADIPELAIGFTMTINEITPDPANPTIVSVPIVITQTSGTPNANTKEVTFVITNLSASSIFGEEEKISTFVTNKVEMTITDAVKSITDSPSPETKLAALKNLVATFPEITNGFTIEVKSASANKTTATSLDVIIVITQANSLNSQTITQEITSTISGFKPAPIQP